MKAIIIGCGRVGSGLALTLSHRGHSVTVVDMRQDSFERLGPNFKGRMISGVGFDRDVLVEAGIERADALAAVTPSDEMNVVAAHVARHIFHVPRVVARVYDPRKAEIYRRLGLPTIAPTAWGVARIADLLTYSELHSLLSLGSGDLELVEVEVPPQVAGRTVAILTIAGDIEVVAITRQGRAFIPGAGVVFEPGDLLHILVTSQGSDRLREMLGK